MGLCVLDELVVVDDLRLPDTKTRVRRRARGPGGMTATALAQAARLGCRARLVSAVGDDDEGRTVLRALRALGVDTRGVRRLEDTSTSVVTVLVARRDGERRFLLPDRRAAERGVELAPPRLGAARALLVDGHFAATALAWARCARERGIPVVGDFADARPANRRLLPLVDHPIVPLEFTRAWGAGGPRETLRDLHARYGGAPVVTLGARGALAWLDGRIRRIAPHRVRAVDTTGAGDAFHGAFAAGLARGAAPADALELASRAGARACAGLGGTASLLEDDGA